MKRLMKWIIVTMTAFTLLGSASGALAQQETPPEDRRSRVRGEVTAVSDTSLTITAQSGQSVTVNVTDETKILLIDSGEGSLSDIQAGDLVGVRGLKNDNGSIQARHIGVLPADFKDVDKIRGKVTAINGNTIVIENLKGSQSISITTTAETKFRLGKEEGSLADIEVDDSVFALGEKQADSFAAKVVGVTKEQLKDHTLRGKVLSVNASAGTLTVASARGKDGTWTVKTTSETKYRVPGIADPTLADVPVGAQVIVLGQPDEGDSKSGTARFIGVIPAEAQGSVSALGEVSSITGATFTLQSLRRGEFTIVTDASTQYLTRGEQEVSLADVKVGTKVIVMGEPVEGQEKSIQATLVGIQLK